MLIESCILDEHVGARPAGSEPGGDPRPPTIRHCLVPLEPRALQPRTADAAPGGGLREPLQARRLAHLGGCWGGPLSRKPSSPASPVTLAGPLDLSGPPCPDLGHRAVSSTWPTGAPRAGSQGTRAQPQASPDTQRGLCAVCTAVEPLGFHEAQFGKHCPNMGFSAKRSGDGLPGAGRGTAGRWPPRRRGTWPGLPLRPLRPSQGSLVGQARAGLSHSMDGLRGQAGTSSAAGLSWGLREKGSGHCPAALSGPHPRGRSLLWAGLTPGRGISPGAPAEGPLAPEEPPMSVAQGCAPRAPHTLPRSLP